MKKYIFLFIICFSMMGLSSSLAQHTLLSENTNSLFEKKNDFGPGMKKFSHLYIGYGLAFDNPNFQDIKLKAWSSNSFTTGWRTQFKLLKFYSVGSDLYYNFADFSIKQYDGKEFPDIELHQKEKLSFHNLGFELYQRITFFKRGKLMGTFLDLGAYINYSFLTKYIEKDHFDQFTNNAKIRTITYRSLNYIENTHYGFHARLGFNKWAIATGYRLSPLLKNAEVSLPPIWFELQLGLHK